MAGQPPTASSTSGSAARSRFLGRFAGCRSSTTWCSRASSARGDTRAPRRSRPPNGRSAGWVADRPFQPRWTVWARPRSRSSSSPRRSPPSKLLLADESLSGLDEHEMDQTAELLRRICRELGVTIIWVEHIMGVLMRVVDRVMVLDHGEKIAELPARVASDPRVIESRDPRRGRCPRPRPSAPDPAGGALMLELKSVPRRLRDLPGAVRRIARGASGARPVGVIGPNGAGKTTPDACHLRADPSNVWIARHGGRRPGGHRHMDRGARRRSRSREPAAVRAHDGRGQSEDGRLRAVRDRISPPARGRLRAVPAPARAPSSGRRQHVGRRAADVRDRPRPHVRAEAAPARRALGRAGAGPGRAVFELVNRIRASGRPY